METAGDSGAGFSFDLKRTWRKVPEHQVMRALGEFVRTGRGRNYSQREWDAWPMRPCTGQALRNRYGSWPAVLRVAGMPWPRMYRYSPEELVRRLEEVWRVRGFPPGEDSMRRFGRVSVWPYVEHWGSLGAAREQLSLFQRGLISREEMLKKRGRKKRERIPPAMRYEVLKRDGFRCVLCGANPKDDPKVKLQVDHINPVANEGETVPENLQTTCERCNCGKRDSV
jgi:HNH endonuclease